MMHLFSWFQSQFRRHSFSPMLLPMVVGMTLTSSLHAQSTLLVGYSDTGKVNRYDASTGAALNVPFLSTPALGGHTMVYDHLNHVFVANSSGIGEYNATTGATINATFITGLNSVTLGMALDSNNRLYLSQLGTNTIGVYNATTGAAINANFITSGLNAPCGVAVDNNNHLFVANQNANTIGLFNATTGTAINTSFVNGQGLDDPHTLLLDGNNHLLVGFNHANASVGKYDATTGATINAGFITGPFGSTWGLTMDENNHLFVGNNAGGVISEYDASTGGLINLDFIHTGLPTLSGLVYIAAVPEPSSFMLITVAAGTVAIVVRRRRMAER